MDVYLFINDTILTLVQETYMYMIDLVRLVRIQVIHNSKVRQNTSYIGVIAVYPASPG